jgi:hypothetical protein
MRVLLAVLIVSLAGTLLSGCGLGKAKGEAELVAQAYFDCIQKSDFDGATEVFSSKAFQETSREDWRTMQEKISEKLGPLQSYKLVNWNVFKGTKPGGLSGTIVNLGYEVTYEKYPAQVAMVVYKPLGRGEFQIVSMNINSQGLLME